MVAQVSEWTWLMYGHAPEPYFEMGDWVGPATFSEIEWLEVDPIERKYRGMLVEEEVTDHTREVELSLSALNNIPFKNNDGVIRIWGYLLKVE